MKKFILLIAVFFTVSTILHAQVPAYYNDVDLTLTGMDLKAALTTKITNTHTSPLSYTPGVWNTLKVSDLDPDNASNVLLIYGYEDGSDATDDNDLERDKDANGDGSNEWNREHVYAKSLATPALTTNSPGAGTDAHNLKPSDVDFNADRGNSKFAEGSGNAGQTGANWYPGDEWKGDVARILMYMYVRYTTQCKPGNACVGTALSIDLSMVDVLLEWNIEDPVSEHEQIRNEAIYNSQGNRNPFIDNPYLATVIWGGNDAENFWNELSTQNQEWIHLTVYPNPVINGQLNIESNLENDIQTVEIIDISGKTIYRQTQITSANIQIQLEDVNPGVYFIRLKLSEAVLTKKIVIQL